LNPAVVTKIKTQSPWNILIRFFMSGPYSFCQIPKWIGLRPTSSRVYCLSATFIVSGRHFRAHDPNGLIFLGNRLERGLSFREFFLTQVKHADPRVPYD
jgi:hypothetical protein